MLESAVRNRPPTRRRLIGAFACAAFLGVIALVAAPLSSADAQDRHPVIFAAASLKNALDAVSDAWQRETGKRAAISYGGSPMLARQIELGAPADIFISADRDWMDYLAERRLIEPLSWVELLGNRIVLVAPANSTVETRIEPGFPLAALIGEGRLAIANTSAVPAGKYGRAALQALGVWDEVTSHLAEAENVRAALALVSRGEAPLGIVYETDAAADPGVRIVGRFPEDSHPPIVYPAALTVPTESRDARAFLHYLKSDRARSLFESEGFTFLAPAAG